MSQMPGERSGPLEQEGFSLEGEGVCPPMAYFSYLGRMCISVPGWTDYLGLSFYFCHH